jgi:hypothetical protein
MKPPKRCIFCESDEKLTKEHVFGKWIKKAVVNPHPRTDHFVFINGAPKVPGAFNRPGAPHSKHLKVVCRTCNNGWMSALQANAKEHVLGLLRGELDINAKDNMKHIASYAAMVTMVLEFSDLNTLTVPQEERSYLRDKWAPPENWQIFAGRSIDINQTGAIWHTAGLFPLPKPGDEVLQGPNVQVTTVIFGQSFIQTISGPPDVLPRPLEHAQKWGLFAMWPLQLLSQKMPPIHPPSELTNLTAAFWLDRGITADAYLGQLRPKY